MIPIILRFVKEDAGAVAVETALVGALVVGVLYAAVSALGAGACFANSCQMIEKATGCTPAEAPSWQVVWQR